MLYSAHYTCTQTIYTVLYVACVGQSAMSPMSVAVLNKKLNLLVLLSLLILELLSR